MFVDFYVDGHRVYYGWIEGVEEPLILCGDEPHTVYPSLQWGTYTVKAWIGKLPAGSHTFKVELSSGGFRQKPTKTINFEVRPSGKPFNSWSYKVRPDRPMKDTTVLKRISFEPLTVFANQKPTIYIEVDPKIVNTTYLRFVVDRKVIYDKYIPSSTLKIEVPPLTKGVHYWSIQCLGYFIVDGRLYVLEEPDYEITITLDKTTAKVGEPVTATATVKNYKSKTITLTVDLTYNGERAGDPQSVTVEPYGESSISWELRFNEVG
jgi:hypothetical protein